MTAQELDDIASRLAKGWVIRRDQIEALIAMARNQLASVQQLTGAANPSQQTQYPGWSRP